MSLLPSLETPRITLSATPPDPRHTAELDALLVIAPESATAESFSSLPEAERWRALHARSKARHGTVRSTALANSHQTWCVLGYLRTGASAFERLALSGRMLKEIGEREIETLALASLAKQSSVDEDLDALLAGALAQAFSLPVFSTKPRAPRRIRTITLFGANELDVRYTEAGARAANLARWLTALPPNKLDAPAYRKAIADLARERGLQMRWLDEAALKKAGANAFLAVSAGNAERSAGIAHLSYRPATRSRAKQPAKTASKLDLALVGKGILFDTGGTNLKPHKSMLDMHTDMAGSAVALGTLLALAELGTPIAVDAWLAITENRIGPTAYRPQDVVRAANGVTIQVIHTDAEGRMALADALALASRTQPRLIVDFATLTGACVYALTERMSGVFTNRPALSETLVRAGRESGERVWSFPFDEDYDSDLESKVADVLQCHVEGRGDHILAARFLSRFVPEEIAWAHLDLSSATRSGGLGHVNTDVTGFGVRYMLELLLRQNILDQVGKSQ